MANMNMTEWQTDAFRHSMVRKLEEAIKVDNIQDQEFDSKWKIYFN